MTTVSFTIPGKIDSVANQRLHWAVKAKKAANNRRKALTLTPQWWSGALLAITLTRHGVRELDDDNLRSAFKATRDGIASRFWVDDRTKLIEWRYAQAKCKAGEECTVVTIEALR